MLSVIKMAAYIHLLERCYWILFLEQKLTRQWEDYFRGWK